MCGSAKVEGISFLSKIKTVQIARNSAIHPQTKQDINTKMVARVAQGLWMTPSVTPNNRMKLFFRGTKKSHIDIQVSDQKSNFSLGANTFVSMDNGTTNAADAF